MISLLSDARNANETFSDASSRQCLSDSISTIYASMKAEWAVAIWMPLSGPYAESHAEEKPFLEARFATVK